jgi:hypothetical protein
MVAGFMRIARFPDEFFSVWDAVPDAWDVLVADHPLASRA